MNIDNEDIILQEKENEIKEIPKENPIFPSIVANLSNEKIENEIPETKIKNNQTMPFDITKIKILYKHSSKIFDTFKPFYQKIHFYTEAK